MNLKLITYNIDGLPEYLDLNTLPWILKPIAWVYKLFKKTTLIHINDNHNVEGRIKSISKELSKTNADIIGIQEDFNYHTELMESLNENYSCGTYTGGFDLSKIFSTVECITRFPLPRFKMDGLGFIAKTNRIKIKQETIKRWKNGYGYFTHANDLLTHKGFRFYTVTVDDKVDIDVYVLHMDADFYNPEKCPDVSKDVKARGKQLNQITDFILQRNEENISNPILIIGDTNSTDKYEWDVDNIKSNLIEPINAVDSLTIMESVPNNYIDVDRAFYINNTKSKYRIEIDKCYFDDNFKNLSDHKPLTVEIVIN